MSRKITYLFIAPLLLLSVIALPASAQPTDSSWPKRVLITNDNGIDDAKMMHLAKAFAKVTETYVAAPLQDRSGTSHSVTPNRKYEVEHKDFGAGIVAYGVDGTPAEAVIFGLQGLLRDKPPDLVISGVNGGENAGMEWLFSGTVGAARMAAVLGVPALAVSGLSARHFQNYPVVMQWIVELSRSKLVRSLKPGQYLTVSLPRVPFVEIKGVEIIHRAFLPMGVKAEAFKSQREAKRETWEFERYEYKTALPEKSDLASYQANHIVLVVMRADENDYDAIRTFQTQPDAIPKWPPTSAEKKPQ
jgi:5'-nucleotidase